MAAQKYRGLIFTYKIFSHQFFPIINELHADVNQHRLYLSISLPLVEIVDLPTHPFWVVLLHTSPINERTFFVKPKVYGIVFCIYVQVSATVSEIRPSAHGSSVF